MLDIISFESVMSTNFITLA